MAGRLGVNRATLYNWFRSLPYRRLNTVCRTLGLPPSAFEGPDPITRHSQVGQLELEKARQKDTKQYNVFRFTGENTALLASFILENEDLLLEHGKYYFTGYSDDAEIGDIGTIVQAEIDGYLRTLKVDNRYTMGGINAVVEDVRMSEIQISIPAEKIELVRKMQFGFLSLGNRHMYSRSHAVAMYELAQPTHAIALCSLLPGAGTFDVLISVLTEYWNDVETAGFVFDTLKKFHSYLSHNLTDAKTAFSACKTYIDRHIEKGDLNFAVSYAVEAIPFVVVHEARLYPEGDAYLALVEKRLKDIGHEGQILLAVQAARAFLPLVNRANAPLVIDLPDL